MWVREMRGNLNDQFAIISGFVLLFLFSRVAGVMSGVTHHRSGCAVLSGSTSLTLKKRTGYVSVSKARQVSPLSTLLNTHRVKLTLAPTAPVSPFAPSRPE